MRAGRTLGRIGLTTLLFPLGRNLKGCKFPTVVVMVFMTHQITCTIVKQQRLHACRVSYMLAATRVRAASAPPALRPAAQHACMGSAMERNHFRGCARSACRVAPAKPTSVLPDLSRLCASSSRMPVGSRARPRVACPTGRERLFGAAFPAALRHCGGTWFRV